MNIRNIFLILLLVASISLGVMANGNKDNDDDLQNNKRSSRRWKKPAQANNHDTLSRLYSKLSHGSLSDIEAQDMQAINAQSAVLESINSAVKNKNLETRKNKNPDKVALIGARQHGSRMRQSRMLAQLADTYSFSLDTIETDNSYESSSINDLLNIAHQELLTYIDLLEKGYNNSDDEDIQVTYLFLQKKALGRLSHTGQTMMTRGITPPQTLIDAVNIDNSIYAAQNEDNYPQVVQDMFSKKGMNRSKNDRKRR